jgi:predicted phosphodiesterase
VSAAGRPARGRAGRPLPSDVQVLRCVRVAALYDIHGNLPALRAVLAEARREGVDRFVIGGDVADGPRPKETLELLMALPAGQARFIAGNSDREVIDAFDRPGESAGRDDPAGQVTRFTAGRLSGAQRDFLAGFAATVELSIDGLGSVCFCHGSPRSDTEIITRRTTDERLRRILAGVAADVIVGGHVHQSYDRRLDGRRIINPGSVGLPYEGRPGAFWALLGPGVELRRTEYDLGAAVSELRAGGYVATDEWLTESLLDPADPDPIAAFFEAEATRAGGTS